MTEHESTPPETPEGPEWVTLSEAAKKVTVSTRTLRRAIKDGRILGQRDEGDPRAPWHVRLEDVWREWGPPGVPAPTRAAGGQLVPRSMVDDLERRMFDVLEANAQLRERLARAEAVMSRRARRRYRQLGEETVSRPAEEEVGE